LNDPSFSPSTATCFEELATGAATGLVLGKAYSDFPSAWPQPKVR
jgi:hypothetical protein